MRRSRTSAGTRLFDLARWAAAATAAARLAPGAWRLAPLAPRPLDRPDRLTGPVAGDRPEGSGDPDAVSVVIPARNEAHRLPACLEGLRGQGAAEILVVDDESTDATAALARAGGATVVSGRPLPPGWVGKPWALQQGLEAARSPWVVFLDADTRPRPGLLGALVAAARAGHGDVVSAGGRFVCDSAGERFVHPAMLATLVVRFGPVGRRRPPRPARTTINGQCLLVPRERFAAAGGWGRAAGHLTDDIALARSLAGDGWRVAFLDGTRVLDVAMYRSGAEVWREWGRSLSMPDATSPGWAAADLALLALTMGLPWVRLATGRADRLDAGLLAARFALNLALAPAYRQRGLPYWLSPLADPAVVARLTWTTLRPVRTWRGRTYPTGGSPSPLAGESPGAPAGGSDGPGVPEGG